MRMIKSGIILTSIIGSALANQDDITNQLNAQSQRIIKGGQYIIVSRAEGYKAQKDMKDLDKPAGDNGAERTADFQKKYLLIDLRDKATNPMAKFVDVVNNQLVLKEMQPENKLEALQYELLHNYTTALKNPKYWTTFPQIIKAVTKDSLTEVKIGTKMFKLTAKYWKQDDQDLIPGDVPYNEEENQAQTIGDYQFEGLTGTYDTLDALVAAIDQINDKVKVTHDGKTKTIQEINAAVGGSASLTAANFDTAFK